MSKCVIVIFMALLGLLKTAECISCYSCYSEFNAGCNPFNSSLVEAINCEKHYPEASSCITYIVSGGNLTYTTRGCASQPTDSNNTVTCSYVKDQATINNFTVDTCYTCSSHMCNGAELQGNTLGVLLATSIFGMVLAKI